MTRSLRVAVLECDTPVPPVQEKLGSYGDIFEGLLKRGLQSGNSTAEIEVSKWHVVGNPVYPDPNEVDAFLLTGSSKLVRLVMLSVTVLICLTEHDAFGDDCWILTLTEYVRDVVQSHKKPVVGICFGHQILARALHARVGRGECWEISSSEICLTDAGKELFDQDKIVSNANEHGEKLLTNYSIFIKCTAILSMRSPRVVSIWDTVLGVGFKGCTCPGGFSQCKPIRSSTNLS